VSLCYTSTARVSRAKFPYTLKNLQNAFQTKVDTRSGPVSWSELKVRGRICGKLLGYGSSHRPKGMETGRDENKVWYCFHWSARFAWFLYHKRVIGPQQGQFSISCITNNPVLPGMANYLMSVEQWITDVWLLTELWNI